MKTVILSILLSLPFLALAQVNIEISGTVEDYATGEPLKNCHVYVSESIGVTTDENGDFKISLPEKFATTALQISHIGYETFEAEVDKISGELQLVWLRTDELVLLDDVVVSSTDPWDDFRDVIGVLRKKAEDKRILYLSILEELGNIDSDFKEISMEWPVLELEIPDYYPRN